ncbi:YcdB/YcdC domain-containing protein [Brevibacillus borstelensis]|uniref:YcdB/YcdC domain-containing protein n=1 Tax=Brevibacillus borstelensis TaxID=45462 RepID=UPI0030C4D754
MNSYEEELERQLRRLKETEPPPRLEYVKEMDRRLQRETDKLKRRLLFRRIRNRAASIGAVVFLGCWAATDQGQQALRAVFVPGTHMVPLSAVPAPVSSPSPGPVPFLAPTQQSAQTSEPLQQTPDMPETGRTAEKKAIRPAPQVEQQRTETQAKPVKIEAERKQIAAKEQPRTRELSLPVKKAEAYLRDMLGEEGEDYRYSPSLSNLAEGEIAFSRMIHGIPVYESSYTVEVEGDRVTSFKVHRRVKQQEDFLQMPKPADILPPEKAQEAISATLRLVYRENEGEEASLRYEPAFSGFLDAKTGEPLTGLENKADVDGEKRVVSVNAEGRKLEAGSSAEVISLLRQEFALPLEEITGPSTITYGGDEGIREFEWERGGKTIAARVDKNGRLLSYRADGGHAESSRVKKASPEAFLSPAVQSLQRYLDPAVKELELAGAEQTGAEVHFRFRKLHQGIPVINSVYEVIVDTGTGDVVGMSGAFGQQGQSYPDPAQAISREAAAAAFQKHLKPELAYIAPNEHGESGNPLVLAYHMNRVHGKEIAIDAISGAVIERQR